MWQVLFYMTQLAGHLSVPAGRARPRLPCKSLLATSVRLALHTIKHADTKCRPSPRPQRSALQQTDTTTHAVRVYAVQVQGCLTPFCSPLRMRGSMMNAHAGLCLLPLGAALQLTRCQNATAQVAVKPDRSCRPPVAPGGWSAAKKAPCSSASECCGADRLCSKFWVWCSRSSVV